MNDATPIRCPHGLATSWTGTAPREFRPDRGAVDVTGVVVVALLVVLILVLLGKAG